MLPVTYPTVDAKRETPASPSDEDKEWHDLLMAHLRGTCDGRVCIFCCVEKIPL
jgi:hypothetical protein